MDEEYKIMAKTLIIGIVAIMVIASIGAILMANSHGEKYDITREYTVDAGSEFSFSKRLPYASIGFSNKVVGSEDMPTWVTASIDRSGNSSISGIATDEPGEYVFIVKYEYSGSISTEYCKIRYVITIV